MPLWSGAGVKTRLPAAIEAAVTISPPVSTVAPSRSVPAPGAVVITTAWKASPSAGSLKPKSASWKTWPVSSAVTTVLSAPLGASFTAVTSIVRVFAVGSVSTPPFAVPPSSCTWKLKLA